MIPKWKSNLTVLLRFSSATSISSCVNNLAQSGLRLRNKDSKSKHFLSDCFGKLKLRLVCIYSGTPPYDHPVYKTTSLLRPYSFKPNVKTIESFYYFEDPVNATTSLLQPGFYGPTVVTLMGFHCTLELKRGNFNSPACLVFSLCEIMPTSHALQLKKQRGLYSVPKKPQLLSCEASFVFLIAWLF